MVVQITAENLSLRQGGVCVCAQRIGATRCKSTISPPKIRCAPLHTDDYAMNSAPETVRLLAEQIRRLESSFRPTEATTIPLGIGGLGELFPQGLPGGSLIELLPRTPGAGAWTLALVLARYACGERKTLLIADPEHCFYPPAARKFGLPPERMIVIRSKNVRDALSAVAESLRCSAIGMAIGAFERLHERDSRRLQLAAEAGGTIGVLVRPASTAGTPSFASTRLLLEPLPSANGRRRLKLETIRPAACGFATSALEIDDATGHVRPFSWLEPATEHPPAARPAG